MPANAPVNAPSTAQKPAHSSVSASTADIRCDVLIIGAGLAGLSTALSLPKSLSVIVLAKEDLQSCSSHYAQGGIAAVIDIDDSVPEHVQDTLIAGDGLCDPTATTHILAQGSNAIDWLLQHHVPFTTKESTHSTAKSKNSTPQLQDLHLTQEGGHGCRRVAHADDATGRHIMDTLHEQAHHAANITLLTHHEALRLLRDKQGCIGATVVKNTTANTLTPLSIFNIYSGAVVLACGGLGQLFRRATAPNVCMGDGIIMAWEIGCRLANLEFVQFHPTGLALGDSNFLISEALRGEGGLLLCPKTGERFMPKYDAREELAPRDIVARAIANEIAQNGLGFVHLDISHKPADFIRQHFPDIYAHCLRLGVDITTDPIPVAPTAHYTCGGVMTTAEGLTDVQGLYAAGEVAHTGLHGANRLASNSLLECVVVGRAIAKHIPSYLGYLDATREATKNLTTGITSHPIWQTPQLPTTDSHIVSPINLSNTTNAYLDLAKRFVLKKENNPQTNHRLNASPQYLAELSALKQLMTDNMGIRRTQQGLSDALAQVLKWYEKSLKSANSVKSSTPSYTKAREGLTPMLCSQDSQIIQAIDIPLLRWQRLLNLAALLLQSALTRLESRGGHYRDDYPKPDDAALVSVVMPASVAMQPDFNDKLSKHETTTSTVIPPSKSPLCAIKIA